MCVLKKKIFFRVVYGYFVCILCMGGFFRFLRSEVVFQGKSCEFFQGVVIVFFVGSLEKIGYVYLDTVRVVIVGLVLLSFFVKVMLIFSFLYRVRFFFYLGFVGSIRENSQKIRVVLYICVCTFIYRIVNVYVYIYICGQ